jgi:hypothetical protein
MQTKTGASKLLWYEGLGFFAIAALSWINELTDLPKFIGGHDYIPNWRESVLETVIIVIVAIPVIVLTRKFISRFYYLEGFLRVCAWCKKLDHGGKWMPLEEFFASKFETETSHGMCETCMQQVQKTIRKAEAA